MFDPRTLFLAGAISCLICALMLYTSRQVHAASRDGILRAALAEIVLGLAMLLIALRGLVPDWASITVGNALGTSGGVLIYESVRRICGARPIPYVTGPALALLIAAQVALGTDPAYHLHRLTITSLAQGGFVAAAVPLLRARREADPRQPLNWAIAFASVYAITHAVRLVSTLASGISVNPAGMVTGQLPVTVMVVLFSIAPMVYAMTLIGLINGRLGTDLRRMAMSDPLTGLATRRSFFEKARSRFAEPAPAGSVIALMMLDLDRFKRINDRYGHLAGDAVLMRFARIMQQMSPPDALLGRYGGEEFCLLVRTDSETSAQYLAARLCRATRRSHELLPGDSIRFTVSIGVATAPADADALESLLLIADRRVYLAKALGRNRFVADERDVTLPVAGGVAQGLVTV